jgi:hypothetical protein
MGTSSSTPDPPLVTSLAVAAIQPALVTAATYPVPVAALVVTASVLVAARRRPETA